MYASRERFIKRDILVFFAVLAAIIYCIIVSGKQENSDMGTLYLAELERIHQIIEQAHHLASTHYIHRITTC